MDLHKKIKELVLLGTALAGGALAIAGESLLFKSEKIAHKWPPDNAQDYHIAVAVIDGKQNIFLSYNDGVYRLVLNSGKQSELKQIYQATSSRPIKSTYLKGMLAITDGKDVLILPYKDGKFCESAYIGSLNINKGDFDIKAADMNNDGLEDIVIATNSGVECFLNKGNRNFEQCSLGECSEFAKGKKLRLLLQDVDNDGDIDCIVINDGEIHMLKNQKEK